MSVTVQATTLRNGRRYLKTLAIVELAENEYIWEITLSTEAGVLANIPMQMRSGVPWPPLPFQDLSALSQAYIDSLDEEY